MMQSTRKRRPRSGSRRGFTLLELMVGVFIALFLTTAAVVFASHETRLLGYSNEQADSQQQVRAAIDMLTTDLQNAGVGLVTQNGQFPGLVTGAFTVGGQPFNDAQATLTLRSGSRATGADIGGTYTLTTHDLGIRTADGGLATISWFDGAAGEFCDATNAFGTAAQLVVFQDNNQVNSASFMFTPSGAPGACTLDPVGGHGQCAPMAGIQGMGCRRFTVAADAQVPPLYRSSAGAVNANYTGGQAIFGAKETVWFVHNQAAPDDHLASLRRAVFDGPGAVCASRATCGVEVAPYVETLQYQVWAWNTTLGAWQSVAPGPINFPGARLRVDVELVTRTRRSDGRAHNRIPLRLSAAPACVSQPADCGPPDPNPDNIPRRAYRWSVSVRN